MSAESFNEVMRAAGVEEHTVLPSTVEQANAWIKQATTNEQRQARMTLTFGIRFGAKSVESVPFWRRG